MPRNRKSQKMRSQKTRKERRNSNTQNEQSDTPTTDTNTQNEQSEAQEQQAHKERVRAFVDSFIFGAWLPSSTLTDSEPVPAFEACRALGNELGNDPELLTPTNDPRVEASDSPGSTRTIQVRPLGEENAEMLSERGGTLERPLDISDDEFGGGVIGDPSADVTPSRSVPTKGTDTDTAYRPRPSSESRRIAALPSRTRLGPAPGPSTPRTPTRRPNDFAVDLSQPTPPLPTPFRLPHTPTAGRNNFVVDLSQPTPPLPTPFRLRRTPTAGRNNFAVDLARPTPPVPDVVDEKPLASPPPVQAESSDKVHVFPGRRCVRRPM
ncbi:hypothetical protein FN846DRAFT_910844 [Sphaerosporella brunnea]|uniref:Uncharacterized protein n=1 Tax=Sphaerosporella brunnea TaxID=1250544 RepID=A0A5J5ELH2_9PEZI|nr:hypothetical protein FN846DRAFT_910844 [Sphaerosporella brunnea]